MEATAAWVGKKVKIDWHLWAQPSGIPGMKEVAEVPEQYKELFEEWSKRVKMHGIVKAVRYAQIDIGRCQWEFDVMIDNGSEWWLPRGAFEITNHNVKLHKKAPRPIVDVHVQAARIKVEETMNKEEAQKKYREQINARNSDDDWTNVQKSIPGGVGSLEDTIVNVMGTEVKHEKVVSSKVEERLDSIETINASIRQAQADAERKL